MRPLTDGAEIRGWLKFFKAKDGGKGFGFVRVLQKDAPSVDVYINRDGGLLVKGTHGEPIFTNVPFDYGDYPLRRQSERQSGSEIIMVVEQDGVGGWRARRWGVLPSYTWVDLYLDHSWKYIEPFIGGRVELYSSTPYGTGGFTARIDGLVLTRETLTVQARHYPFGWDSHWEPDEAQLGRAFERSYPLAAVIGRPSDRDGWFEVELKEADSYSRLTFRIPGR
jgi:hypothetical protein